MLVYNISELPTPKIPLQDFFLKNSKISGFSGGASGLLFKVSQMYLDSSFQTRSAQKTVYYPVFRADLA
jgi:hypothetical protein